MNQENRYILIASLNLCMFSFILQLDICSAVDPQFVACKPINCRHGPNITFPFYIQVEQESYCGYPGFALNCSEQGFPVIHIGANEYVIKEISYQSHTFQLENTVLINGTSNGCISEIKNVTLDNRPFKFVSGSRIYLLSNCNESLPETLLKYKIGCGEENRNDWGLAMFAEDESFESALQLCKNHATVPVESNPVVDYQQLLRKGFRLSWTASNCSECAESEGLCGFDEKNYQFKCFCPDRPHSASCKPIATSTSKPGKNKLGLIIGLALGGSLLIILVVTFIVCRCKKEHKGSFCFPSRNKFSDSCSKYEVEEGSLCHGVPVFSYTELEDATSKFHSSRELGDGGFGAVYYGKLGDGREVAVKRLYEHNCKRMEQFKNEVEILTRLKHPNLVALYGCTSKHSRELLLVYEYIANGTVADHLHGDRAKDGFLAWPTRMSIAIETASALAYLHASEIIHRDVKTNNILLDSNCCVKVADFGLSRLFPNDVTHVSTAPQGTPGYVDPDYHECYQLTTKSDVYSFGVVLVELVSSMPAVDISRHRHEINLSNFAISKIQRRAFDELIDPSLGFASDADIRRMTTSVAGLAFQCLQHEKDLRPTMDEVLETLKHIQGADDIKDEKIKQTIVNNTEPNSEHAPTSPKSDNKVVLKKMQLPPSPISVTESSLAQFTQSKTSICLLDN